MADLLTMVSENPFVEIVAGWKDLTDEDIQVVKTTPGLNFDSDDWGFLYILKNLSPYERKTFYKTFQVKPEYRDHFDSIQNPWIKYHEYLLGLELDRKHEDASHKAIVQKEAEEILSEFWDSENVRCRLFYAMKFPNHIEFHSGSDSVSGQIQLRSLREIYDFISQNHRFD